MGEVVIDCHDPVRLSEFWQRGRGYVVRQSHEWAASSAHRHHHLVPIGAELQGAVDRVHLDVDVGDPPEATAAAQAAGVYRLGEVAVPMLAGSR